MLNSRALMVSQQNVYIISLFSLLFLPILIARLWEYRRRVLARAGEHLLVNQSGHLQAPGDPGGLGWAQNLC